LIRGLYTAAAGMMVTAKQSDTIDENIENLRNPGYRETQEIITSFPRLMAQRVDPKNSTGISEKTNIGILGTGVVVDSKYYIDKPGNIRQTENKTDFAINSGGYFVVETLAGERYTRNGHFQVDPSRRLRTSGGNPVLGENGVIGPLPQNFTIDTDGTITDTDTHAVIDKLRIVDIPASSLKKEGMTTLFSSTEQPKDMDKDSLRIYQGYIEESNVNIDGQMVKMLEVVRAYSANQKVIQTNDSLLEKAVNDIGKV